MNLTSKLTLSTKLIACSLMVLICSLSISTYWISSEAHTNTNQIALQRAEGRGQRDALSVKQELDRGMERARLFAISLQRQIAENTTNRESVIAYMRGIMASTPGLAGVWVGFEANAYDGYDSSYVAAPHADPSGRFMPYFYNFGKGIAQSYLKDTASEDYYNLPKQTKKPFLTPPTQYAIEGQDILMTSAVYPILDEKNGTFLGVVGFDILLNDLSEKLAKIKPGKTGSVNLISHSGLWVSNTDKTKLGKRIDDSTPLLKQHLPDIKSGKHLTYREDAMTHILIPLPIWQTSQTWSVVVNIPNAFLDTAADELVEEILLSSLVLLILLSVALYVIGNKLIRTPMQGITTILGEFEHKNFTITIPNQTRGDEIGSLSRALEDFRQANLRMEELETQRAKAEQEAETRRTEERHLLANEFEAAVGDIIQDVTSAAQHLSSAASHLLDNAEATAQFAVDVATTSTQTSANVQTVATATEELSASINEIASQVAMSSEVVNGAVGEARAADNLVKSLALSANKISEIVVLINDIANQTNLLALNATIEAARAGDAGKGFAVVAGEVKNLASQTARATEDITQQIEEIQSEAKRTAEAIRNISGTIDRVNETSSTIAAAIEEQGAATGEISQNVQQAADGTNQVNVSVAQIREQASNVGEAAGEVKASATQLNQQANILNQEVHSFLTTVRG